MAPLLQEEPFAYVVLSLESTNYCSFCMRRPSKKLSRCSKCKFAHFCNRQCQTSGWPDHRQECSGFAKCTEAFPSDTARLIARVIWRLKRGDCGEEGSRPFSDLMSHREDISKSKDRSAKLLKIAKQLTTFMDADAIPSSENLLEIYGKIVINSLEIYSYDNVSIIGKGVYLNISTLDHSCEPNATVVFKGKTAVLNSLKRDSINSFDPAKLRINYIPLFQATPERQKWLQEHYYFLCDCARCQDVDKDAAMEGFVCQVDGCGGCVTTKLIDGAEYCKCTECGISMERMKSELGSIQIEEAKRVHKLLLEESTAGKKADVGPRLLAQAEKTLKSIRPLLHPLNIHRFKLSDFAFDVSMELAQFDSGAKYGREILPAYRYYYPQHHPTIGSLLFNLGKMLGGAQDIEAAFSTMKEAASSIAISHGKEHALFKELLADLKKCAELKRLLGMFKD